MARSPSSASFSAAAIERGSPRRPSCKRGRRSRRRRRGRSRRHGPGGRQGPLEARGGSRHGPRGDRRRLSADSLLRVLALDHGEARCGCAIHGSLRDAGAPAGSDRARSEAERTRAGRRARPELVVVGLPVSLSGEEGEQAGLARGFAAAAGASARCACRDLRRAFDHGRWPREATVRGAGDRDSLAAAHLLESYLASRGRRPMAEREDWMADTEADAPVGPHAGPRRGSPVRPRHCPPFERERPAASARRVAAANRPRPEEERRSGVGRRRRGEGGFSGLRRRKEPPSEEAAADAEPPAATAARPGQPGPAGPPSERGGGPSARGSRGAASGAAGRDDGGEAEGPRDEGFGRGGWSRSCSG